MNTDYIELKRKALQEAIKKHKCVIDDLRAGISTVLNEMPVINVDNRDAGEQAQAAESIITTVNPLGDQLEFANDELKLLYNMIPHQDDVHNQVEPGSIVVTDHDTFFVSASIERFQVNGRSMFGLSKKSPLYQVMKGKKEGDIFSYKGMIYAIREIF